MMVPIPGQWHADTKTDSLPLSTGGRRTSCTGNGDHYCFMEVPPDTRSDPVQATWEASPLWGHSLPRCSRPVVQKGPQEGSASPASPGRKASTYFQGIQGRSNRISKAIVFRQASSFLMDVLWHGRGGKGRVKSAENQENDGRLL